MKRSNVPNSSLISWLFERIEKITVVEKKPIIPNY